MIHSGSAPSAAPGTSAGRVHLRVAGSDGRERVQEFVAASSVEAVRQAAQRGLIVLSVESEIELVPESAARDQFPLLLFSQELLALLEAGLNLNEAIATLRAKERREAVAGVLADILSALREGRNFSDVLAGLPRHFPEVFVATVRASERTGDLPNALARYIAYQLQFDTIRRKLVSAAIYPVMLLVVGSFVTLFLLGYVVPKFASVYHSAGRDLPWLSSVLLVFGGFINKHWPWVLAGLASGFGLSAWLVSRPQGRARLLNQILRLPWLAERSEEFRLARFYRAVSLLLAAGIALPRAMGMVTGMLSTTQQGHLTGARLAVEEGKNLSEALLAANLASPVADSLIRVGERSGQLAEMLERAARFHDDDFSRWIDWATKLLEPILMTVIGIVIGTVVVLMYLPIFDLAGGLR